MTGANHGDEYEGPVALLNLANSIKSEDIKGRIIIIPMMNYPAFVVQTRTSPIDQKNLNRTFPGKPNGTITQKIADYFQRTLLPMADVVVDIHAGGKTLDFIPFAAVHVLENVALQEQCIQVMEAFNAPYSMMLREIDSTGMYDSAAEYMGKVFISTELGGGGSATARTAHIAKRGILNVLKHAKILQGDCDVEPTINLIMPSDHCFITSQTSGLLEMCVDLDEVLKIGQTVALVHNIEHTGKSPVKHLAMMDGILTGRHFPGLIGTGDCLAVISVPK